MKVGIYADPHITRNMRNLQAVWEESATKSILEMYKKFDKQQVDFVVCLGDFFDKPVIEAKSIHLVLPILNIMNSKSYPTYLLLGNHEIDSSEHNILEYLSEYENIKPVTDVDIIRDQFTFIPYSRSLEEVDQSIIKDKYVFTHHDIYGSELAGGKTKAFFGADPSILKDAKRVYNGHVHLKSRVSKNIINAGSLLVGSQGELKVGEYPVYYIIDTEKDDIKIYENKHSMIYLTINIEDISQIVSHKYDPKKLVLKVEYSGDLPDTMIESLHTSYRKLIDSISGDTEEVVTASNFDMKNYIVDHIKGDVSIDDTNKSDYIDTAMEMLS